MICALLTLHVPCLPGSEIDILKSSYQDHYKSYQEICFWHLSLNLRGELGQGRQSENKAGGKPVSLEAPGAG
jgi:hypothetical protein